MDDIVRTVMGTLADGRMVDDQHAIALCHRVVELEKQLAISRRLAMEEAADICDSLADVLHPTQVITDRCAAAIRTAAQTPVAPAESPSESELRELMRDPRYWRHREPGFVKRVTDGWRALLERTT